MILLLTNCDLQQEALARFQMASYDADVALYVELSLRRCLSRLT